MTFEQPEIAELQSLAGLNVAIRRFQERPTSLHLMYGHSSVYTISLAIGSATRQPLAVIDGAMRFNSYTLSRIAKFLARPPKALLAQTYITRSFTAFQTEAAIITKLPRFIVNTPCRSVIILGLLDTYYDEQIKPLESQQSLRRIIQTLRALINENINVLIADVEVKAAPSGKETLFQLIYDAADRVTILEYDNNGIHLHEQRRTRLWDATTIPLRSSSTRIKKLGASSAEP